MDLCFVSIGEDFQSSLIITTLLKQELKIPFLFLSGGECHRHRRLGGILGNCMAPFLCRLFKVAHPVARGIAIGTASHALGTSKAIEMGEIEGAMSGLSIAVCGLMTVLCAQVFAGLL